jgi:hypothetical protein
MKRINTRIIYTLLLTVFGLSSCLEDTGYTNIFDGENKDIPIVSVGQSEYGTNVKTVEIQEGFQNLTFPINIARAKSGTTNVTVELNTALLDEYNEAELAAAIAEGHGASFVPFEMLPEGSYQIPSSTISIPEGQLDTDFVVQVNSTLLDLTKKYLVPLRITNADNGAVVASNLNTSYLAVVVKNKYDGHYKVFVTMNGWDAYDIPSNNRKEYPDGIDLLTAGATKVTIYNPYFGADLIPGFSSTGATAFGATSPEFTFDANDNLVAVRNTYPPDSRNRTLVINPAAPAGHNVFDPTTKSLIANFIFKQSGRPDNNVILEMTYEHARP